MAAVGLLAMLPHIASFLFLNIGGYFADYLTNKGIKLIVVRKLCNSIAFGGSGICLCIVPELNSVAGVIAIMCLGNDLEVSVQVALLLITQILDPNILESSWELQIW